MTWRDRLVPDAQARSPRVTASRIVLATYRSSEGPLGIEHVLERHDGIVSEADKDTQGSHPRGMLPLIMRRKSMTDVTGI